MCLCVEYVDVDILLEQTVVIFNMVNVWVTAGGGDFPTAIIGIMDTRGSKGQTSGESPLMFSPAERFPQSPSQPACNRMYPLIIFHIALER